MIDLTENEIFNLRHKPDLDEIKPRNQERQVPWLNKGMTLAELMEGTLETKVKHPTFIMETFNYHLLSSNITSNTMLPDIYTSRIDTIDDEFNGTWSYNDNNIRVSYNSISDVSLTFNIGNGMITYFDTTPGVNYSSSVSTSNGGVRVGRIESLDAFQSADGKLGEILYEDINQESESIGIFNTDDTLDLGVNYSEIENYLRYLNIRNQKDDIPIRQQGFVRTFDMKEEEQITECEEIHFIAGFRRNRFIDFLKDTWYQCTLPFFKNKWFHGNDAHYSAELESNINIDLNSRLVLNLDFIV